MLLLFEIFYPCTTSILGAEGLHLFKGPGLFVSPNVSGAIIIPHPTSTLDFRVGSNYQNRGRGAKVRSF